MADNENQDMRAFRPEVPQSFIDFLVADPPPPPALTAEQIEAQRAFAETCKPATKATKPAPELRRVPGENLNCVLDIDELSYFADPCDEPSLSAHIAHAMVSQSPLHAHHFHPRLGGHQREPSSEKDNGTLAHALLLGKGMDRIEVVCATEDIYTGTGAKRKLRLVAGEAFPDWKLKAAQDARDAAREAGRVPLLQRDVDRAREAADIMRGRLLEFDARALEGDKEVSIFWVAYATDGTPVQCRGRIDILDGWTVRDPKTCRSAHPKALQRQIEAYGYDVQAAAYVQAVETVFPKSAGRARFEWLFLESSAPYPVTPVRFGGSMRSRGEARWQQAVDTWAICMRTGHWPQYVDQMITIEASPWGMDPVDVTEEDEEQR